MSVEVHDHDGRGSSMLTLNPKPAKRDPLQYQKDIMLERPAGISPNRFSSIKKLPNPVKRFPLRLSPQAGRWENEWVLKREKLPVWSLSNEAGKNVLALRKTDFFPIHTRVGEYALIKEKSFSSFDFSCDLNTEESLSKSAYIGYVVLFNYENEYNYYYVRIMLGAAHQQLQRIVNGTAEILAETSFRVPDPFRYHTLRVKRLADSGQILVFFDQRLLFNAVDRFLLGGTLGVGSYMYSMKSKNFLVKDLKGQIIFQDQFQSGTLDDWEVNVIQRDATLLKPSAAGGEGVSLISWDRHLVQHVTCEALFPLQPMQDYLLSAEAKKGQGSGLLTLSVNLFDQHKNFLYSYHAPVLREGTEQPVPLTLPFSCGSERFAGIRFDFYGRDTVELYRAELFALSGKHWFPDKFGRQGIALLAGALLLGGWLLVMIIKKTITKPVLADPDIQAVLEKAKTFITEHLHEDIKVKDVAKAVNVSESLLYKLFQKYSDLSIFQNLTKIRMERAKIMLEKTGKSVAEICTAVGINDQATFSKAFKKYTILSPLDFRKKFRI